MTRRATDPRPDDAPAWLGAGGRQVELLARLWATVDLERTLTGLGLEPALAGAAIDDPLLGARVVILDAAVGDVPVALAEPTTEGRLAGRLARHDEGPAGIYLRGPVDLAAIRRIAAAAGVVLSPPATGPFGRSVAVAGGPIGEAVVILVDPAAVPSRP